MKENNLRPFILTRSFFTGIHRYAAVWTGDSDASYEHLAINISLMFGLSMNGIVNCGADIPGFEYDHTEDYAS